MGGVCDDSSFGEEEQPEGIPLPFCTFLSIFRSIRRTGSIRFGSRLRQGPPQKSSVLGPPAGYKDKSKKRHSPSKDRQPGQILAKNNFDGAVMRVHFGQDPEIQPVGVHLMVGHNDALGQSR